MANEATKIFPRIQNLVSEGRGADLGCGPFKLSVPNAIGVDPGGYEGIENKPALEWLKDQSDASLDWVFSSHYLEHEPQHAAVLAQVNRVLKPGGSLLVYLPDKRLYKDANGNDPNGDHVNHWTPGLFVDEVIDNTDLQVVAIEKRHTSPPGHAFTGNGDTEHPGHRQLGVLVLRSREEGWRGGDRPARRKAGQRAEGQQEEAPGPATAAATTAADCRQEPAIARPRHLPGA
jgi:SAM-dependent methyltransferase